MMTTGTLKMHVLLKLKFPKHSAFFFLIFTGLPVQVRDAALKLQDDIPKSDVNKEYYTQRMEREVSFGVFAFCLLIINACGKNMH